MNMIKKFLSSHWTLYLLLICGVIINNYWVATLKNDFLMDDFNWLKLVQFSTVQDIFHFLPVIPYNDRPVGAIFIKILHQVWGMNALNSHRTLLILHIFNCLMVFTVIKKGLTRLKKGHSRPLAFISALIFGMWPNSTMAVQWVAAIFDLLGATLCLLSMDLFLDATDTEKQDKKVFSIVLSLIFYYLALRTKEMTIVLPVIFLMFHFLSCLDNERISLNKLLSYRPPKFLFTHLTLMLFFLFWIMRLKANVPNVTTSSDNPYFYTFNPVVILTSLLRYLDIFFQFDSPAFSFQNFTIFPLICIGLFALLFLYGLTQMARGHHSLLFLICAILVSLAPVLPMANMQHRLYWYIPSIFMALLLGVMALYPIKILGKNDPTMIVAGVITGVGMFSLTLTPAVKIFRDYWSGLALKDRLSIEDIRRLPSPKNTSNIFVQTDKEYNIFYYGPGDINAIIFNRPDLKTYLSLDSIENTDDPFYTMAISPDGHIVFTGIKNYTDLVHSDSPFKMVITRWGPSSVKQGEKFNKQPNGQSAVWIAGRHFSRNALIVWNGKELQTVVNLKESVLTALVPDDCYDTPGNYPVIVRDSAKNKETEPVYFQVQP